MSRIAALLAALLIVGCAAIDAPPPEIVKELAPTGRLRAAQLDFTAPYMILDGRPRVIAVARGRPEAGEYLRDFLDDLKATGFVAAAIERNGARDRASAP